MNNYYKYVDKRLKCLAEIKRIEKEFFWRVIDDNFEESEEYVIDKEHYKKIIIPFQTMWGNKRLSTMLNDLGVSWSMRDGVSVIRDDRRVNIENIWGKVSGVEN